MVYTASTKFGAIFKHLYRPMLIYGNFISEYCVRTNACQWLISKLNSEPCCKIGQDTIVTYEGDVAKLTLCRQKFRLQWLSSQKRQRQHISPTSTNLALSLRANLSVVEVVWRRNRGEMVRKDSWYYLSKTTLYQFVSNKCSVSLML